MRPIGIYRARSVGYIIYSGAGDGLTTIIIMYRLRTFNSSMWGSLRLAPTKTNDDDRQLRSSQNVAGCFTVLERTLTVALTVLQAQVELC